MNRTRSVIVSVAASLVLAGMFPGLSGCLDTVLRNQTKERTGNISMVFINNTPHRAIFSYAAWDAWNRAPGPIDFQQIRVEGDTATAPETLRCARNAAIGTQDLLDRALITQADEEADFDPDAFTAVVNFSSAPIDSDAAGMPTEGTALGIELLLGVDYSCADQIVFTFEEDPDASGGFRIDYEVIRDEVGAP